VREWGKGYGYEFSHEGKAGDSGADGGDPVTDENKDLPVTYISWRDIVVWCNAYSEMTGKEAVYYDSTGTILLRKANQKDAMDAFIVDKAQQLDRNGYRLPTEKEWEYAARGGVPSNDAESAWAYKWAGTGTEGELGKFAWYDGAGMHSVREKKANSAGLYDMSGNVYEWCFSPMMGVVARGGMGYDDAVFCTVGQRVGYVDPGIMLYGIGFRLVCR
jgi:formylglycine-generating enzyme required for sulfatase activity